jgi:hypothetical protein
MATREVKRTGKDDKNDITRLCGDGWSVTKADAIRQIEGRTYTYEVRVPRTGTVDVKVVSGPTGKYLRTDPDKTRKNNLLELPDC